MSLWLKHPGVRTGSELTLGERAADHMRAGMGSWTFVFGFLGFMVVWSTINIIGVYGLKWDPYPFILLNLFLSMLAGLQGAILLIAAKRSDQIAAEVALHTLEAVQRIETMVGDLHRAMVTGGPTAGVPQPHGGHTGGAPWLQSEPLIIGSPITGHPVVALYPNTGTNLKVDE